MTKNVFSALRCMTAALCSFLLLAACFGCASSSPESIVRVDGDAAARPDATVSQPDATVGQPDATVGQPDATVGQPDATVSQPDATVSQPDATVSQPDATVSQPDAGSYVRPDGYDEYCDPGQTCRFTCPDFASRTYLCAPNATCSAAVNGSSDCKIYCEPDAKCPCNSDDSSKGCWRDCYQGMCASFFWSGT